MDPSHLELEITESTTMQNPEKSIATLRQFKEMGIRISIDDFGTGYSSLNYLRRIPFDSLKIDRSFVMNINTSPDDAAIVRAIIAMAHSLKLRVIAEGVETEGQFAFFASWRATKCRDTSSASPFLPRNVSGLLQPDPQASGHHHRERLCFPC
jgi:EAL domain-containing protein (putative c-di-GMP-specific phosphodiesterase class I)